MSMDLTGFVPRRTTIKIGEKEFVFGELTLFDLAQFRAEIQNQREEFNQKRRDRIVEDAKKIGNVDPLELLKFVDKPLTEDEVDSAMETTEGLAFLAYLSLKHHHQEVSKEDAARIVTLNAAEQISKAMFSPATVEKKTAVNRKVKSAKQRQ